MSEYQYYEFRAVDRPLTTKEMSALRAVSSRGEISTTSYTNEYEWGDFKGDPDKWMERYFDAFVYFANWGTKTLKLRLPKSLLPIEAVLPFCGGEQLSARSTDEHTIVTFDLEPYDGSGDWQDNSGIMASLIGLRAELARGDLRCLYLGWLIDRDRDYGEESGEDNPDDEYEEGFDPDDLEPPIPAGLAELTASQQCFVEFFGIDVDLWAAAATASPTLVPARRNPKDLTDWLASMPQAEKDALLLRVLEGPGPAVGFEMEARFQKDRLGAAPALAAPVRRTDRQLQALKHRIREARLAAEQARAAASKKKRLDDLAKRLPDVWVQVEGHMESKKTNEYDMAVRLLQQIEELAERGEVPDFAARMEAIRARHSTKKSLLGRLRIFN